MYSVPLTCGNTNLLVRLVSSVPPTVRAFVRSPLEVDGQPWAPETRPLSGSSPRSLAHDGGPGINQPPNLLDTVRTWRKTGTAPFALQGHHAENGKPIWELTIYAYPTQTGWNAVTKNFEPVDGKRGGVERIAERFRPSAAE